MVENNNKFSELEKQIIAYTQGDLPLDPRPFKPLADQLGISETEVITRIKNLKAGDYIRRFGAVLRHQKVGYQSNALVAWEATTTNADQAGEIMAGCQQVSHCYLRETPEEFGYNLFTMIHACSETDLQNVIEQLARASGLSRYTVIRTRHEYKKTSMVYY